MKRTAPYLLLATGMLFASCQSEAPRHEEPRHEDEHHEDEHQGEAHAHHGDGASGEALPLRPIMQQLGSNMAGFIHSLWLEEYVQMEEYAEGIAAHPHISD